MIEKYGIDITIKTAIETALLCSRQTGRTSKMVNEYLPGDIIMVLKKCHAQMIRQKVQNRRSMDAVCVVMPIDHFTKLPEIIPSNFTGKIVFDHQWIEEYYRSVLADATELLEIVVSRSPMPMNDNSHKEA